MIAADTLRGYESSKISKKLKTKAAFTAVTNYITSACKQTNNTQYESTLLKNYIASIKQNKETIANFEIFEFLKFSGEIIKHGVFDNGQIPNNVVEDAVNEIMLDRGDKSLDILKRRRVTSAELKAEIPQTENKLQNVNRKVNKNINSKQQQVEA